MGFKRRFFGDKYLNREGLLKHLYYRVMIRGWFIDLPILIAICYFIPWDKLIDNFFLERLIYFMESWIPNIQKNREYSDFPEYSVSFLSTIHFIGVICLFFPIFYSKKNINIYIHLRNSGHHPIKIIFFGFLVIVPFLLIHHIYLGAITYFGCEECSYHNKISLIIGAIIPWFIINFLLLYTLIIVKNYLSKEI